MLIPEHAKDQLQSTIYCFPNLSPARLCFRGVLLQHPVWQRPGHPLMPCLVAQGIKSQHRRAWSQELFQTLLAGAESDVI